MRGGGTQRQSGGDALKQHLTCMARAAHITLMFCGRQAAWWQTRSSPYRRAKTYQQTGDSALHLSRATRLKQKEARGIPSLYYARAMADTHAGGRPSRLTANNALAHGAPQGSASPTPTRRAPHYRSATSTRTRVRTARNRVPPRTHGAGGRGAGEGLRRAIMHDSRYAPLTV